MVYVLSFLISTLLCWALIPSLIRYASRLGMVDEPGERKVHSVSVPRCGGVAIAIGAVIAVLLLMPLNTIYYSLLIGGLIIVLFGVADDILALDYKWKFLGQIAAVGFVISQGIYIKIVPFMGHDNAPLLIGYALTFFLVIGATNAVNFSDGLDGLAAGVMLLSFAFIALLAVLGGGSEVAIMAIAVAGGMIGFLRFNTHPAVIFMGDTGSQFIGFMGVFLAILLTQNVSVALNPGLPLLIMGLPILDTLSVITQRIRAGCSPFSADKRHIHHKLLVYGFTHEQSVMVIYLLHAVFLLFAFRLRYAADWEVIGIYLLVSCSVLMAFYIAGVKQLQFNSAWQSVVEKRRSRLRNYTWLFPFCRVYIEYSIIAYLTVLLVSLSFITEAIGYMQVIYLLLSLVIYKWVPFKVQNILIRIAIYNSVLYGYFVLFRFPAFQQQYCTAFDVFFFLLLFVFLLAVHITRQGFFKMTTQDVLVFLFMLVAILLLDIKYFSRAIFYLFCLGYALEYLFHREVYKYRLLRVLTFFCVLNFSMFFVGYF